MRKRYEYEKCYHWDQLHALGKDGWELVCCDANYFYLKREL